MIRYNANSPEIFGKKQYNVLRGFTYWCLLFGTFHLCAIIMIFFVRPISYNPNVPRLFCYLLYVMSFFSSIYILSLGVSLFAYKRFIPSNMNLTKVMAYIYLAIFLLVSLPTFFVFNKYTLLFLLNNAIDAGFSLYLFYNLYMTIKQQVSFPKQENTESPSGDFSSPMFVTCFEKFDPLESYGRILLYNGALDFAQSIISMMMWTGPIDIFRNIMYSLGFTFLSILCGICLIRRSEFGRMVNVLIHFLVALYVTGRLVFFLISYGSIGVPWNYMWYENLVLGVLLWTPFFYRYYFVIRTLTSPIVKHVCLRKGHDIE